MLSTGIELYHSVKGMTRYEFEHLNYSNNFNGNRHIIFANLSLNNWNIFSNSSILNANSTISTSDFVRSFNRVTYNFNKQWVGTKIALENNEQTNSATQELTPLSQKFTSYEVFYGIGDSSNVFAEIGFKNRVNDSIRNNELVKVNTSNTYYLESKLLDNKHTNLSVYLNYRKLKNEDESIPG